MATPHASRSRLYPAKFHSRKRPDQKPGIGGTRHGFQSRNEIEDMEIFDADPGKDPTLDDHHGPKSIDDDNYQERK